MFACVISWCVLLSMFGLHVLSAGVSFQARLHVLSAGVSFQARLHVSSAGVCMFALVLTEFAA